MEAIHLKAQNDGAGSVYYVVERKGQDVGHAYYVPDESKLEEIALNHEDNGYGHYPRLKVEEVLKYGTKYF